MTYRDLFHSLAEGTAGLFFAHSLYMKTVVYEEKVYEMERVQDSDSRLYGFAASAGSGAGSMGI